ncbi:kelch-like protein 10 [Hemibagrus wyckioides]|uniref:kelch-like protein 10 n=1 Tax=Hemibagrus wyckioides TaxID=337641 RepID=UPI00266C3804|nr:kelch-like protein 10 [Hemibagrus wyckioides]
MSLFRVLNEMRLDGSLCDAMLRMGEVEYNVHKTILSGYSKYFSLSGAPMHSCRCYVSVAMLDRCIYAMGAFNGTQILNTAECYEPSSNQWRVIPSMHEQRCDASAATLNSKIYICGGFNGDECLLTAECYDPDHEQWTLIEPMHMPMGTRHVSIRTVYILLLIYSFTLTKRKPDLLQVGGFDGDSLMQSIEAFDPRTKSWRILSPMFTQRRNFGIEVMDGRLYVIGGYSSSEGTTSTCDVYKDKWFDVHFPQCSQLLCGFWTSKHH